MAEGKKDSGLWILILVAIVIFGFLCMSYGNMGEYTVEPGDSWYSIAEEYNVSVEHLLAVNGAKEDTIIHPGEVIKIPSGHTRQSQQESTGSVMPPARIKSEASLLASLFYLQFYVK